MESILEIIWDVVQDFAEWYNECAAQCPLLTTFWLLAGLFLIIYGIHWLAPPRHKGVCKKARKVERARDIRQGFDETVKATAARVRLDRKKQEGFTTPITGVFPVEQREYSVTDKKTGHTDGGSIQQSELNLVFRWEGEAGWSIRGTRHAKGFFHAIEEGFVSRNGTAYWVERGSNCYSVLSLVQFTSGTTFDGEWLTSLNEQGRYVNCLETAEKHPKTLPQQPNFKQMSFNEMLQQVLEELLVFLRFKSKRYRDDRPLLQIV